MGASRARPADATTFCDGPPCRRYNTPPHCLLICANVAQWIDMPGGMNGVELAREIRQRFPTLPVLLTSGYSEGGIEAERGGFAILAKPYRAATLADAIARCLAPT
jgi:CheY-like chemotaxis protein